MIEAVKHGLPPVAAADARVLVLGSLPGEASLAEGRYYAHPRNQFWVLMERVIGSSLASLDYLERLATLGRHGIALWDVVASARRRGSLDGAMREVAVRDLAAFVAGLPWLRAIGFNGATAAALGRRALVDHRLALIDLPSSSPAFTLPLAAKAERWAMLRPYLIDAGDPAAAKPGP